MSYIANGARLASLTIGGIDYTSSMTAWTASDNTAYNTGCLITTGSVVLGRKQGSSSIEDYDRNAFKRGMEAVLEVTYPDGTTERHPRGLLYVLTNSYDTESDSIIVELICKLGLMNLNDQVDELVDLSPIHLDPAQKRFENISAAFASVGQYIYQDNQGDLQSGVLFDGDTTAGHAPGEWLSVSGVTALSVSPLAGTEPIPDRLKIQYQVPAGALANDNTGYIDTVTDVSQYWLPFPAIVYDRVLPSGSITNLDEYLAYLKAQQTSTTEAAKRTSSSCGNEPSPPAGPGLDPVSPIYASCTEQFQLAKTTQYVSATRTQTQSTYYDAVGGQVSRVYAETYGPALEANSQYYADKYSYCRQLYASSCDPNGSCPLPGQNTIKLGYVETINYYGDANELVKTVQDTYATTLSAAQPSDWRAGVSDGSIQLFDDSLSETTFYRNSRQVTEYYQEGNANIQKTTNYQSAVSRGVGIGAGLSAIDALNGVVTSSVRSSTTTATLEIAPDRVNTASTSTDEKESEVVLFTGRFVQPPSVSGPYIREEQVPMPLLFETESEILSALASYENYISRLVKGDAFGLSISEALRKDIATNWRPGMPFRYYDALNDELLGMRMDACSWGVTSDGAVVGVDALWTGVSDGTVTLPDNLVGNSQPIVDGGVDGETDVNDGAYSFVVDVSWYSSSTMVAPGADGLVPEMPSDLTYEMNAGFICFCAGLVVETGSLLSGDGNGGIPIELGGNLLTDSAVLVEEDLFATA